MPRNIFWHVWYRVLIAALVITTSAPTAALFPAAANAATQNVTWTSLVNTTATGNSLKKSGGCDGCDDAGAISSQQIASGDGAVEFTATDRNSNRTVGINSSNGGTKTTEIDFGFKLWNNGLAEIRENDTYRTETTYVVNDRFKISYEASKVKYYKNGVLLYTSTKTPLYPAFLDTSLWSYKPASGIAASIGSATITFTAPNQAPTVSITSPSSGAIYPSGPTITINATAADSDGTVSKVEFYSGATKLGEDTASPYSFTWSSPADGTYSVTAKATDNSGTLTTSGAISLTVSQNVVWASLVNATPFGTNNNGLKKSGGCDGCDDAGAISRQQLASGNGYLEFTANDTNTQRSIGFNTVSAGTTAGELDFYFKLWNTGPYVDIFEGNTSYGRFTYAASDVLRIVYDAGKIKYYKNGTLLYTSTKTPLYPVFVDTSLWSYSSGGAIAASVGNVLLKYGLPTGGGGNNQTPTISITSPANGASFASGSTVTISANASDPDGSVSKVEFFDNLSIINTDTASPYTYSWNGASVGNHTITARVTDNLGAVATDVRTISITAPTEDPTIVTDKNVHNIPTPPPLPAAGGTFTDPVFGRTIMRLTSSANGTNCRISYAYWPSFNANNTKFHAYCDGAPDGKGARLFSFDPAGFRVLSNEALFPAKPASGKNVDWETSIWSGSDPNILYTHDYTNLYSYNVSTKVYTLVKNFSSLMAAGNTVWQPSRSMNDDVWAFTERTGTTKVGYVVYKRSTNQRLYRVTSFPYPLDEVQLDKSGRYLVIKFAAPKTQSAVSVQVLDIQTGVTTNLTDGSPDYAPGHSDNGTGKVVGWGDWVNQIINRSLATPHQFTNALSFGNDWMSHNISMLANNENWALISTYNTSGNGLFREEVFQVANDGSGKVRRLAHHHAVFGGDYFNQPNANISLDGKFVAFTSNWGSSSNRRDVFIIKVPAAP